MLSRALIITSGRSRGELFVGHRVTRGKPIINEQMSQSRDDWLVIILGRMIDIPNTPLHPTMCDTWVRRQHGAS